MRCSFTCRYKAPYCYLLNTFATLCFTEGVQQIHLSVHHKLSARGSI